MSETLIPALAKDNTGSDPLSLVGGALRDVSKLLADLKAAADKLDSQIADIDKKIKDATPIIGPYCERNYCPPVIPPVDPAGDYCKHNPCPHLPFGL
jgi:hypothetical protein